MCIPKCDFKNKKMHACTRNITEYYGIIRCGVYAILNRFLVKNEKENYLLNCNCCKTLKISRVELFNNKFAVFES